MAKNKPQRSMDKVGHAQRQTEKTTESKFAETQNLAHGIKPSAPAAGRISPQLSCTVSPEDKQLLNELTLFASNKAGKIVNTSLVIRALIRLGSERKGELIFE